MLITSKIFFAMIIAAFFTACSTGAGVNSNANQANQAANQANSNVSNSIRDDVDELEMIIKTPFHPEEAVWREETLGRNNDRVPGPTDRKLVAVLRFLHPDAENIVAQADKSSPVLNETINPENWFPAELIAQSQMSGDETLKGKSYPANEFFNSPYLTGKITRIEGTDYFVLELHTQ